jgi:hypothetical protein
MAEHPVDELRRRVTTEFSDDLPPRVHRVHTWCSDPQFFPGATGLIAADSWSDVEPGSAGAATSPWPIVPDGGVIVVGNYQATWDSYKSLCAGEFGGFPTTWRVLRQLLTSVSPREVFLTNAFIGLPDLPKDTSPFPATPSFRQRCGQLLVTEIELFRPRCIVCLGVPAAKMLASITPALAVWRPWPGYGKLAATASRVVPECSVRDMQFRAVAVQHPSAVISRTDREQDATLIAMATRQ